MWRTDVDHPCHLGLFNIFLQIVIGVGTLPLHLLPVVGTGCPGCQSDLVGSRKKIVDLPEGVRFVLPVRRLEPRIIVKLPILILRGEERWRMGRRDGGDRDPHREDDENAGQGSNLVNVHTSSVDPTSIQDPIVDNPWPKITLPVEFGENSES